MYGGMVVAALCYRSEASKRFSCMSPRPTFPSQVPPAVHPFALPLHPLPLAVMAEIPLGAMMAGGREGKHMCVCSGEIIFPSRCSNHIATTCLSVRCVCWGGCACARTSACARVHIEKKTHCQLVTARAGARIARVRRTTRRFVPRRRC